MNKFMGHMESKRTGMRYPDEFNSMDIGVLSMEESSNPIEHSLQDEYVLMAEVGVIFRANKAEYDRAKTNAIQQLHRELYSDLFPALSALRSALYARDIRESFKCVDILSDLIGRES